MVEGSMSENGPEAEREPASSERIRTLRKQITDLRKRLPKHSIPPAMLIELEDLEEELEKELARTF
jgi:hypothetical protein